MLKSAELTGQWEQKLRLIEKGEYSPDVFKQELYAMIREITDEVIFNTPSSIQFFKEPEKKGPFELMGKKLTDNHLNSLLTKGNSGKIKGFVSPAGEKLAGNFLLTETFNIRFKNAEG